MSEFTKVASPESSSQGPRDRLRDTVSLVFVGIMWIVIFAYGVYIKTI